MRKILLIAKAYFDKATDKKQAINDIIHMRKADKFLATSGFLNAYME